MNKSKDDSSQFTADDIQELTLVEGIRKRPPMYIGGTDFFGFINYVVSAFDILLYHDATWIEIEIRDGIHLNSDAEIPIEFNDGGELERFEVYDFEKHKNHSFRMLPDGVVLHALSESLTVSIHSLPRHCEFHSENAKRKSLICRSTQSKTPSAQLSFVPDQSIFSVTTVSPAILHSYCRRLACLYPGVKLIFKGEESVIYHTTRGIPDLFDSLSTAYQLLNEPIYIVAEEGDLQLEAVIAFHSWDNHQIWSYVNKGRVPEGGTHEEGLISGVEQFFKEMNRPEFPGVFAVLSIQYPHVTFEGCIKNKISNPELFDTVQNLIIQGLKDWAVQQSQEFKRLSSIERFQFGGIW